MIPDFTNDGSLPIHIQRPHGGADLAPWRASTLDVVKRFATTPYRIGLLRHWLDFRKDLAASGFCRGFQWVDGSFVERHRNEPRDLDVVTFCHRPNGLEDDDAFGAAIAKLAWFDHRVVKQHASLDLRFVDLSFTDARTLVQDAAYWATLYGHRRDGMAKGFVQVELGTQEADTEAAELLQRLTQGGAV